MKKIYFVFLALVLANFVQAQEFNAHVSTAKSAYNSGKLDDSRFAMQQMLQEIDMMVGKEILKLLPAKLEDKTATPGSDNVSGASGFLGVTIHRDYGTGNKAITLQVISNSPMLAGINAMLSLPLIANTGDTKVVKVGGYKALIQKNAGDVENTFDYDLQLPLKTSLLTLTAPGYTQDQVVKMANSLPIDKIAKLLE